jgi:hypothetical protein
MRPISVVRFEQMFMLRIAVAVFALLYRNLSPILPGLRGIQVNAGKINIATPGIVGVVLYFVILVILLRSAGRRASRMARSIITGFFLLQTLGWAVVAMAWRGRLSQLLDPVFLVCSVAGYCFNAASVWFLSRPDSNAWFKGTWQEPPLRSIFE